MTSGRETMMSSPMREKKLGEGLTSDGSMMANEGFDGLNAPFVKSVLVEGSKIDPEIGLGPSACSNPFDKCNPALCEGQIEGYSGGLNCAPFADAKCPDDLSELKYVQFEQGKITCADFNNNFAINRIARCFVYKQGKVCTKAGILHPHNSGEAVV